MFITTKRSGYTRDGQQFASGLFLILTQPKESAKYPSMSSTCSDCGRDSAAHDISAAMPIPTCSKHGVMARLKARVAAKTEPSDADFNESPVTDCPECEAHSNAVRLAGCRYFRPSYITYPIRALVRFVSMSQMGHFMMGRARVHGETLILSGSYGSDGLPDSVSDAVYESGIELPADLRDAWSNGNGWNSAGSEASAMRQWALANLAALRA